MRFPIIKTGKAAGVRIVSVFPPRGGVALLRVGLAPRRQLFWETREGILRSMDSDPAIARARGRRLRCPEHGALDEDQTTADPARPFVPLCRACYQPLEEVMIDGVS